MPKCRENRNRRLKRAKRYDYRVAVKQGGWPSVRAFEGFWRQKYMPWTNWAGEYTAIGPS